MKVEVYFSITLVLQIEMVLPLTSVVLAFGFALKIK